MPKFYTLDAPKSPWGDYSDILITGIVSQSDDDNDPITLERTGPYVPPISFPWVLFGCTIVVTDSFRKEIEMSGLKGLRFREVDKKHIVHLDWHEWDQSSEEPAEYPESGEPEDYILDQPHSKKTSEQMGKLWEILIETKAKIRRQDKPTRIFLVEDSCPGADLFKAEDVGYIYATEAARLWFERHAKEHVHFKNVEVV